MTDFYNLFLIMCVIFEFSLLLNSNTSVESTLGPEYNSNYKLKDKLNIVYKTTVVPNIDSILDLYNSSDYYPIADKTDISRIEKMHRNADIIVTAWADDKLIGLARSISDFCYCCYLSDLCVNNEFKRKGIGTELVKTTKMLAGKRCKLILQSSSNALDFYRSIGMEQIATAFIINRAF
jgi:predicted GNAT family N-acyltransferase